MLYFEDLEVGKADEAGHRTVSKESIVEFASEYDPQPFHVDEGGAEESIFDGLVASGLQTLSLCNALATEAFFGDIAVVAGRGIDELRFYEPVRPGDSLWVRVEIASKEDHDPRPDCGHVEIEVTGYVDDERAVVSWTSLVLVKRRDGP